MCIHGSGYFLFSLTSREHACYAHNRRISFTQVDAYLKQIFTSGRPGEKPTPT